MWYSELRTLGRAAPVRPPASRRRYPLALEPLEDRCLLSAQLVADIAPGPGSSNPSGLVTAAGKAFFWATPSGTLGAWASDGTAAGTTLLRSPAATLGPTAAAGDRAYFATRVVGPPTCVQVWRSDGTPAGTGVPYQRCGATSFTISQLTPVRDSLYFVDRVPSPTRDVLMRVGGGAVAQFLTPPGVSGLTAVGDTVFFATNNPRFPGDPGSGVELWASDGTPAGTRLVKDINPGPASSLPRGLAGVGGLLYFSADDGTHGRELWVSDGTDAGTYMVADLNPGPAGSDPQNLIEGFGTYALFTADTPGSGREPWVCCFDGVTPTQIADIRPGPAGSDPQSLLADAAGFLYLTADDGSRGRELWFSDWTPAGTRLVKDIRPGPAGSDPQSLRLLYGYYLYFSANDGVTGRELWASDGSEEFTVLDTDLNPGPASSDPNFLVELPDAYVYFAASRPNVGRELFRASPFFSAPGGGAPAAPDLFAGQELARDRGGPAQTQAAPQAAAPRQAAATVPSEAQVPPVPTAATGPTTRRGRAGVVLLRTDGAGADWSFLALAHLATAP